MARNLPWTQDSNTPKKALNKAKSQIINEKRDSRSANQNEYKDREFSPVGTKKNAFKKRTLSRTPSTSPPPGPPEIETMLDGHEVDEIYIMVEDEFHSVAQAFTAHLHHAEYQRLKKRAKTSPKKVIPESRSPMRAELKHQIRSTTLENKQKRTIENVIVRNGGLDLGATSDEEESDYEHIEDLWSGTALAGLMTNDNFQKTSLVGLEKLTSDTRASKGFSRQGDQSHQKNDPIKDENKSLEKGYRIRNSHTLPLEKDEDSVGSLSKTTTAKSSASFDPRSVDPKPSSKVRAAIDAILDEDLTYGEQSAVKNKIEDLEMSVSQSIPGTVVDEHNHSCNGKRFMRLQPQPKAQPVSSNKQKLEKDEVRKTRLDEVPRFII